MNAVLHYAHMRKSRFFVLAIFLALCLPSWARAASPLVKGSSSAVYYIDEGKRYVFPNEKIYFSWYRDFSGVRTVSDEELASYVIGGNVTYRPGSRLVKLQSDPRVFAVGAGGRLRWVSSETAASALYGTAWNTYVDDLSDAFFFNYKEGEPIASYADFDRLFEQSIPSISDDVAARSGASIVQDSVAVKSGVWSDAGVWGGTKPGTGGRVVIPATVRVVYDLENGPTLKSLDVRGALAFAPDRSAHLAARQITVSGSLTAGSSDAPLPAIRRIEIMLVGAATTGITDDGFAIDGGTLALYGADVGSAWTRLAAPANPGASKITLEAPVAWPLGSEIAVLGASNNEQESRRIKAIEGSTLTLDRPLEKAHRSEEGLRSEVALLGRNISIQGVGGGMGASVHALNHAAVTLKNTELVGLGRSGVAGQYTLFLDGVSDSVIASNVIRDSDNRCVTLRQASGARLEGNVAIDVSGHCFATEDGAETDNAFSGNLVAHVRAGALPHDGMPAAFLLRHPGNRLEGNVAVGSAGFGYWYWFSDEATTNAGVKLHPREADLGLFENNVARANAHIGLYIDDGKGAGDYIPEAKATFTGLVSVLNGERGFWMRGVNVEVMDALIAENPIGGTFAAFGAVLKRSRVLGRLATSAKPGPAHYGFTFNDGPVSVQDVAFAHFTNGASAFGFEEKNAELPDPRNSFSGVTFTDATAWSAPDPFTPGDFMSIARDLDRGDVIGTNSIFLGSECLLDTGNVRRCPGPYAQVEVALRGGKGDAEVLFTELEGNASVTLSKGPSFDGEYAYATVAEGGSYRVDVANAPIIEISYEGVNAPLLMRVPAGLGASVRADGAALAKKDPSALVPGSWAYDHARSEAVLWLRPGDAFELTR